MIDARFVSIEAWPGEKTPTRKVSPFAVKYVKLLDDLERELKHLGARDIVIQAFVSRDDIRNDGWPRSSARFFEPGIILSFRNRGGDEISFPCDTYRHWECNLRAICLTLTALRAIDRYGVTKRAEQYKGWKRLDAPTEEKALGKDWALDHLARLAMTTPVSLRGNQVAIDLAYRAAAKKVHPDTGGSVEAFQTLQRAVEILREAR